MKLTKPGLGPQLSKFLTCQKGATAIEYGLIAALIGVGIIGGLSAFGSSSSGAWGKVADKITTVFNK